MPGAKPSNVFIAFLRGINVGGRGMIAMADLKTLFAKEGFLDTRTLLQSGNVVFKTKAAATTDALEKKIAAAIAKRFAANVKIMVRTPDELKKIVARNPFPDAARDDPSHLLVDFLSEKPTAAAAKAMTALASKFPNEPFSLDGREFFIHYSKNIGESKFTNAIIDRTLGVSGTARNWNTVTKLIALADEVAAT